MNTVTKSQMAEELGLSLRTFQRKLDRAGLKIPRGLIDIDTQIIVKAKLGFTHIDLIQTPLKKD